MDLLKQVISALVAAAFPSVTNPKLFQLSFLNPQIPAELWLITAGITFVASFFVYGLAKPLAGVGPPTPPASAISVFLAMSGLLIAVLSLIALICITQKLVSIDSGLESVLSRLAYILLFIGMGLPLGWSLGRTLG